MTEGIIEIMQREKNEGLPKTNCMTLQNMFVRAVPLTIRHKLSLKYIEGRDFRPTACYQTCSLLNASVIWTLENLLLLRCNSNDQHNFNKKNGKF